MTGPDPSSASLVAVDSLTVDVLTDDVSDNYVSKTLFVVSEFANVIRGGATVISGGISNASMSTFSPRFNFVEYPTSSLASLSNLGSCMAKI